MVKLYALSTCPWCKKVKQLLAEMGVPYDCVDVDKLAGAEQEQAVAEVERLYSFIMINRSSKNTGALSGAPVFRDSYRLRLSTFSITALPNLSTLTRTSRASCRSSLMPSPSWT